MTVIGRDTRVTARGGIISSTLDDEEVLLDAQQGKYFGLNNVGHFIWSRIKTPTRVSDLCEAVFDEYDVDRAQCEKDVVALLEILAQKGLIEVENGGDS